MEQTFTYPMIGFDDGSEPHRRLDGHSVEEINADLSGGIDISGALRLAENSELAFIGTQKSGPFDLFERDAKRMIAAGGNPNGRPNSDVIKPWINAADITRRPRHKWIIDFGTDMSKEDAAQYEKPFAHVLKNVKPLRDNVRRGGHREKWWLFGEARPGMRSALAGLERFICTPRVSKHRIFVWVPVEVLPGSAVVAVARDDDYFMGVLQSRIHEIWSRRQGTQLREATSGQRYTPSTTFDTFPFPWTPGAEPKDDTKFQAISDAADDLMAKREAWLKADDIPAKEVKKRTFDKPVQ